jgi:hypothetical protein
VQTKETKRIDQPVRSASHGRGLSVCLEAVYKYKRFMHREGGGQKTRTGEETHLSYTATNPSNLHTPIQKQHDQKRTTMEAKMSFSNGEIYG